MGYGLRFRPRRVLCAAAFLAAMAAGCDESLPPRLPDPNAISADMKILGGRIIVSGGQVGGNGGLIEASVTNIYTEVLQDTVAINIRCGIWLAVRPDSVGRAVLDASSLTTPNLIQNGMLTLLPRATALFESRWDYTTLGGTPFWNLIPLKDTSDLQGPFKLSAPVEVVMYDTIRIFKPVPDYIVGPRSATVQFEVR